MAVGSTRTMGRMQPAMADVHVNHQCCVPLAGGGVCFLFASGRAYASTYLSMDGRTGSVNCWLAGWRAAKLK